MKENTEVNYNIKEYSFAKICSHEQTRWKMKLNYYELVPEIYFITNV